MSALTGRTALVTGASRGIGLAVARALAGAGADVIMIARGAANLAERAREVGARHVAADVGSGDGVRAVLDAIASSATPDVLVNNAGVFRVAPFEETTPADFDAAVRTNLVAPFLLARALLPAMRAARAGHLITIGSVADRRAFPGNAAYAATKFGARAMHEVLRDETRGSGVRASLVSPGPVDTPLWDEINPDSRPGFTRRSDMLDAGAVADAVLWIVTRPATMNVDELRLSRT